MDTRRLLAGAAALALIGALAGCGEDGAGERGSQAANAQTPAAQPAAQASEGPAIDADALAAKGYALGDVVLGDPNAPVTMIEYASLTCPACQAFHQQTVPGLKTKYVETGKVKVIVRELHGARIGLYAAALARCDGPEKYHAFLDVLFARQDAYRTQDSEANLAELRRIGRLGGLSAERIEACLNDNAYLNALYRQSQENIERDEPPATPYLIIQPGPDQQTIRGAADLEQLSAIIDPFLAE